jgi:hypothetical protein
MFRADAFQMLTEDKLLEMLRNWFIFLPSFDDLPTGLTLGSAVKASCTALSVSALDPGSPLSARMLPALSTVPTTISVADQDRNFARECVESVLPGTDRCDPLHGLLKYLVRRL